MNPLMSVTIPQQTLSFQSSLVLSRQEAKTRLRKLKPGSVEHSKLQAALIKAAGIVEISLPTSTYRVNTFSKDCRLLGGFGSSEHVAIGEAVKLKGLPKENTPLFIKGVTPIQFQHIVALAGDFYGVADEAISLPGGTNPEKTERFKKAFNTLAQADNDELRKVLLEIDHECTAVKYSSLPHHCYSSHMLEKNKAIKKIKNDIDALLIDNSDHFSANAEDTYRIGHALALSVAMDAGKRKDLEGLKQAYALDAFACHFLTDLFAAGHIRNQRGELESFLVSQLGFSKNMAKPLAGILTGAQHEKDGNEGLNVSNKKGDHWRAFGDGSFFEPKNKENREKVISTTQKSVDEIYYAYLNPDSPEPSTIDQLIPSATPFNPLPLYTVEGTSLFLHQVSNKIKIESQLDYLKKGISQALKYLPEKYIHEFITPFNIEVPPLIDKVIIPQMERLTGFIWHMIGLATYHQIKQENQQLNEKVDEMASALMATCENSSEILRQIQNVNAQLNHLSWSSVFQEIQSSIATIKDISHQYKSYILDERQLKKAEDKLWEAYIRIARVFCEGTAADGRKMVVAYATMLEATTQSKDLLQIKIIVTLWFRQILDYQVQAFCLHEILQVMRNGHQQNLMQLKVSDFESNLMKQLEANKDHIDETLIYQSQPYIALQLQKNRIKRLAFKNFTSK